jgi:hypothetical protein
MLKKRFFKILSLIFVLLFCVGFNLVLAEGSAVDFSGKVKKVLVDKNKVGIKDPKTKKRFTVVINDESKLNGFSSIKEIKKGDLVEGKYVVTSDGKYIAQHLTKK